MALAKQLATILARSNPKLWEMLHPHEPSVGFRANRFDHVLLNPQPLPPKEAFLVASAQAAHDIANAVIAAEAAGGSPEHVMRAIEDWCGTPRPFPWPWPWPGPWPGPDPEPHPDWDVAASRLVGALTLGGVAARMRESPARDLLERGADQLLDAAVNQ